MCVPVIFIALYFALLIRIYLTDSRNHISCGRAATTTSAAAESKHIHWPEQQTQFMLNDTYTQMRYRRFARIIQCATGDCFFILHRRAQVILNFARVSFVFVPHPFRIQYVCDCAQNLIENKFKMNQNAFKSVAQSDRQRHRACCGRTNVPLKNEMNERKNR